VREFIDLALKDVGRTIEWRGKGVEETCEDKASGRTIVRTNPRISGRPKSIF
jgi:GDPmannose 4,6-dehydratase